jgi:hypothetical protein
VDSGEDQVILIQQRCAGFVAGRVRWIERELGEEIRIETGYPNTELNMVYFFPALSRRDSKPIAATEVQQQLDGKTYQRWSRHRTAANPWKIGRDHIGTHVILVEDWLDREFEKCPLP